MFNATLNFNLGGEIDILRGTVRRFAAEEIAPHAGDIDRDNAFPPDLWEKMGALGLHGITIPKDDGGAGMGYLAHCVAIEEISRASASVGLSYGAYSNLCINQIARWGTAGQKSAILAATDQRCTHRLAGDVGTGERVRCRVDEIARRKTQRSVRSQRQQDVDYQRP